MSDTLVRVDDVSKKFCRDLKRSLWYGLKDLGNELLAHKHGDDGELRPDEFWAVKDVSFELRRGDCLGLIGPNGAGKTTLLRLLNGLIKPDQGLIALRGRVGALIALGAGFNPILTGRENIQVNAAILGFSRKEITRKFKDIVEFSELGDFMDAPVQQYSSGMHVRLGFSIAVSFDPDLLIIDEALSVGDSYFRAKSFERIKQLRDQGVTIVFVSHDNHAIAGICNRVMLLNAGEVVTVGSPTEALDYYNALIADRTGRTIRQRQLRNGRIATTSGTGAASIEHVTILNSSGDNVDTINVGATITLVIRLKTSVRVPRLIVGYLIKNTLGQAVYGTNTDHLRCSMDNLDAEKRVEYRFTFAANIGPGSYSVTVALHGAETHISDNYEWRDMAVFFDVVNLAAPDFVGVAWLAPHVECLI